MSRVNLSNGKMLLLSTESIMVPSKLSEKYLKIYNKFSVELYNALIEDTLKGEQVGSPDALYVPETRKSIPLIQLLNCEELSHLSTFNAEIEDVVVVTKENKYSVGLDEAIQKEWQKVEDK